MPYKYNPFTGNLDFFEASAAGTISTINTDSGAAAPAAGAITITGGTGINTSGAGSSITVNLDSPVTVANGGTGATTLGDGFVLLGSGTGAVTALDVTAKGSLLVGDGTTDPVALAVGTDTFVLTADSAEASGVKWAAGGGGGSSPLTTKGDIYVYAAADARLPVGTDGYVLSANSAQSTGLEWIANTSGTVTSVSGTTNRVSSTGGATPVIDIDAAYVGQASITTLGTVTTGTWNGTDIAVTAGGTGASTAGDARTNLGVAIGTDVQAYDAGLADIAGLAVTDGNFIVGDGANWVAETGATARTSLGLGSIATQDSSSVSITGGSVTGITDVTVADGGTGASSFTAYAVVCGGTTGTGALQSISGVGSSGEILTSNGAGALPTFQPASGGGMTWSTLSGTTQTAAVNNGYILLNNSLTTVTLPTTAAVGDIVRVTGTGTGYYTVDYGTSVLIHFADTGTDTTVTSGSLTATDRYASIELICVVADLRWNVISSVGNFTVA